MKVDDSLPPKKGCHATMLWVRRSWVIVLAVAVGCNDDGRGRGSSAEGLITSVGLGTTSTGDGVSSAGAAASTLPATLGDGDATTAGPADESAGDETTDGGDMSMVFVPAGPFLMGCTNPEVYCWPFEEPLHEVTLSAYWIDRTEVPRADYLGCMNAGACTAPASEFDGTTDADLPVVHATWFQAESFCAWQQKRLPTEAEWEKAARGTDAAMYPWGMAEPNCTLVNYQPCGESLLPVDSLPAGASPYGALQMSGNVWEWVSDWHGNTYYANSPAVDPTGPASPPAGEEVGKGFRGGAYPTSEGEKARLSTARRWFEAPETEKRNRGFRCAQDG